MKKFLTILLAGIHVLAFAQKKSNISRSVDDDGKTMHVRVTGEVDGRQVDCDRTFDVARLNDDERAALRDQVLESFGLEEEVVPQAPATPEPPAPPVFAAASADEPEIDADEVETDIEDDEIDEIDEMQDHAGKSQDQGEFAKLVKYNPETGQMFLRYQFVKNGEEFIYEKTADVPDKSDSERARIIHDFETEIELPGRGI
ncbi:hypothetical protein [Dyadobacter sandarakinus]|uniref:Uncharacterized protein n=1 Tax=Dyadobacter sandarakinus TaxID=2747268 RepID=A0ABX7I7H2_9BACT|nr:hypothetical protein [Dyadobacter sandarakinus]QRR01880.1 hypothetical protein HWI92_13660 [Dyadobacter sandarakinus]